MPIPVREYLDNPSSATSNGINETVARTPPVSLSQRASDANILRGSDNWEKTFFYRSFERKQPRNASIAVMEYNDKNTPVRVTQYPIEYRFIVNTIQMPRNENVRILQTFGDDLDVLQTFGASPMIWSLGGVLRNEARRYTPVFPRLEDGSLAEEPIWAGDGDWRNGMVDAYNSHLRATQLVRRGQFLEMQISDMLIYGYIINLTINESADNDMVTPFGMQFYVRSVDVPNNPDLPAIIAKLDKDEPQG